MTRAEWIDYHDRQAAKHGESDFFCEKFCQEIFMEEVGMFQYTIEGDELMVQEVIGNLYFWDKFIPPLARSLGCKKIIAFANTDKPGRLERLYKTKLVSQENGICRFERTV